MVDGVKGVGMQGDIRFEEEVSEDGTETEESESDDNPNHPARRYTNSKDLPYNYYTL